MSEVIVIVAVVLEGGVAGVKELLLRIAEEVVKGVVEGVAEGVLEEEVEGLLRAVK